MNEKNLIPFDERTESEQREIARQGGIASGQARREKKTIQKILTDYLNRDISSNKELYKVAHQLGLSQDNSIKELVTAACIINTMKKGDIDKLSSVMAVLGESVEREDTNKDVEETLAIIKECAYGGDTDKS